jgi:hypothetical protein
MKTKGIKIKKIYNICIFFRKMMKSFKEGETDRKVPKKDKKRPRWMKSAEKQLFWMFLQKNMEKCRKRWKIENEEGSNYDSKDQKAWKRKKTITLWIFEEHIEKILKKVENDEKRAEYDKKQKSMKKSNNFCIFLRKMMKNVKGSEK